MYSNRIHSTGGRESQRACLTQPELSRLRAGLRRLVRPPTECHPGDPSTSGRAPYACRWVASATSESLDPATSPSATLQPPSSQLRSLRQPSYWGRTLRQYNADAGHQRGDGRPFTTSPAAARRGPFQGRGPAAAGGPPGAQGYTEGYGQEARGIQHGRQRPYSRSHWQRQTTQGWFLRPDFTPATLYEEIVRRCEKSPCEEAPLFLMCNSAASPQEARIALAAFAAARSSLVRHGNVAPFSTKLAVAFVDMVRNADAPDVLVEALTRSTELGLLLSPTQLHHLLRHWGQLGELAKIEEVLGAMPLGGVPYSNVTAYIVIRTAVNLGAQDKAEYYASAMMQRQVRISNSAMKLLELGRERQRQRQMAAVAADSAGTGEVALATEPAADHP